MPYRYLDARENEMAEMADKHENCYQTICQDLLNDKQVTYTDNKRVQHTVYLADLLKDYELGMDLKDVIEAEAKRIAESIF